MNGKNYPKACLALILFVFYSLSSLYAAIIYVDQNALGPTHDGSAWKFAFLTLQEGIDAAVAGDEIWVAKGDYLPTKNIAGVLTGGRDATFYIDKDIKIYGGFDGSESSLADRDLGQNFSAMDGDIGVSGSNTDNAYHVVIIAGVTTNMVLDGLVIKNGNATGPSGIDQSGGGIYIDGASAGPAKPMIKNCKIINNRSNSVGGGVYNLGRGGTCAPVFTNTVFAFNVSFLFGGAVYNENRAPEGNMNAFFYNCNFYRNFALAQGYSIYQETISGHSIPKNRMTVTNCIFYDAASFDIIFGPVGFVNVSNSIFETAKMNLYGASMWTDGGGNIDQDPLYANIVGPDGNSGTNDDDFRVDRVCSPAIDNGNGTAYPVESFDIAGNKRILSTMIDMGAYEYSASGGLGIGIPLTAGTKNPTKEFTDLLGWTHYCDCSTGSEALLLSVEKGIQNIGSVGDIGFSLDHVVNALYGTNAGTNLSGANYLTSPSWWVINRYWDLNPVSQPTIPVKVRFYFTNQDFSDVQTSYPALSNETDMVFFKTEGGANPHDLNPSVFTPYTHDLTSSISTWTDGVSPDGHKYGEYEVTSFSGGGGGGGSGVPGGIFPVEYVSFEGRPMGSTNHLTWQTAQEQNSAYFEIQRSADAIQFETIGQTRASGNTQGIRDYFFIDKNPHQNLSYYRLKQVDIDGDFDHSSMIEIRNDHLAKPQVFPNPFTSELNILLPQAKDNVSFELFHADGRRIFSHKFAELNERSIYLSIPENMASGCYHYRLRESGAVISSGILFRQ